MRALGPLSRRFGGASRAELDAHAEAIRDLQHKLAELTAVVARLDASGATGDLRGALRDAVDDLGGRIAALAARVDEHRP